MMADVGGSGNEEIDDIARAFNEITAKFRAAQGNLVEQERLQKEMQVAQEIQQSLLPRSVPELRDRYCAPSQRPWPPFQPKPARSSATLDRPLT